MVLALAALLLSHTWSAPGNGLVFLDIHQDLGTFSVFWKNKVRVDGISAEARLSDGSVLNTASYARESDYSIRKAALHDELGSGFTITMEYRSKGRPTLREILYLYDGRPELFVRLEAASTKTIGSNYLVPIKTDAPIQFSHKAPLQSLLVPYDNDAYVRYRSDGWGQDSYEVGAVYDDESRRGLVVGSIDHKVWKSGVRFKRDGLVAYAGAAGKGTHDSQPHGTVTGKLVSSPRMAIGYYDDWRHGLERYGDLNALVRPPLRWKGGVPFGWNSWSGHKDKVTAEDARAATDFIKDKLPGFRNDGIAYINFDSYWDNLKPEQLFAFVQHAHALGLRTGIYCSPFVGWGDLGRKVAEAPAYTFRDLALKGADGKPLPKLDGGWPLDPTHPGTMARIDKQLADFMNMGFDYVKLDFLTHGALEGRHFNPTIETGTEAYAFGMRRIVDDLTGPVGRPVFISLSIAPLFPSGFGHSRRISCDIFANIGATEYLLNSASYGWWSNGRLAQFDDGDSVCVYQPRGEPAVTEQEARSRMTASTIAGGMLIDGDDLTKAAARERVSKLYSNREVLELARRAIAFRPVWGDTGSNAGDTFEYVEPGGKAAYVAVFNLDKTHHMSKTVMLSRLGLSAGVWDTHELWTGENRPVNGYLTLDLDPMDCALLRLSRR